MKREARGTRQRSSVAVSSGKANDDDGGSRSPSGAGIDDIRQSNNNNKPIDNKYNKRRRRKRPSDGSPVNERRVQFLGLTVFLLSIFMLARYIAYGRRDRQFRYERAQTMLKDIKDSNTRHRERRRGDYPNEANDKEAQAYEQKTSQEWELEFMKYRSKRDSSNSIVEVLRAWLHKLDEETRENVHGGRRWIRPFLLPGYPEEKFEGKPPPFSTPKAKHLDKQMKWQTEYDEMVAKYNGADSLPGPPVDYTDPAKYRYPTLVEEPPAGYPQLTPLGELLQEWDQDSDYPGIITETLMHFNFSNPVELAMAKHYRDAMVPFKLTDVPEIVRANKLWTDEYVAQQFEEFNQAMCQVSPNHYFAFYNQMIWKPGRMGLPPYRTTDWDFSTWSKHARYADAIALAEDQPHFYFQAGAGKGEKEEPIEEQSFISRDLPSFNSKEANFLSFNPEEQKGIQCRFGERGVVAATHYDSGRNMVAMIQGAKRYILSPPKACGNLGIVTERKHPIYRHSLLDFGHIKYLEDPGLSKGMSDKEREWLERAKAAPALETVLKAGEVLYIPSFWFHYIVSVQKSAQCNVRSGVEVEVHNEFGGERDVEEGCTPS